MEQLPIEVFKTNITNIEDAVRILKVLNDLYPKLQINFDLDDCDKILRVEGEGFLADQIIENLALLGFICEVLK